MSSIAGGMSQITDLQSQIWKMYNNINNATIEAGQKFAPEQISENEINQGQDFVKALEEQFQRQNQQILDNQVNFKQDNTLGVPAGMNISEVGETQNSYESMLNTLIDSFMNNLNNKQNETLTKEIKNSQESVLKTDAPETTGTLAFLNTGANIKNQAGNFIQKLIDSYKDKGSIIGLNV